MQNDRVLSAYLHFHYILHAFININNKQKMDRTPPLLEKLHQMNTAFNTKTNKYFTANTDTLQSKLELLKKKINITIEKNKQDLQDIAKETNQLYEKVQKTNRDYQAQAEAQLKRLRDIQDKFLRNVQLEILSRKQRENEIIQAFEHKANSLRHQIQKEQKARESLFSQTTSTLQNDLPMILSTLQEQKQIFLSQHANIEEESNELIEESEKNMKEYIIEQQSNNNKIFELIRDLTKKIKMEIQEEKHMCDSMHEEVFQYIEDGCSKIGSL